jgi:hypothetical protein
MLDLKPKFMKPDPELPEKFATSLIEQIALLRAEMIAQRSLLIELLSRTSHERRRKIKERLYDKRMAAAFRIAPSLRKHIGLKKRGWLSRGFLDDEEKK